MLPESPTRGPNSDSWSKACLGDAWSPNGWMWGWGHRPVHTPSLRPVCLSAETSRTRKSSPLDLSPRLSGALSSGLDHPTLPAGLTPRFPSVRG